MLNSNVESATQDKIKEMESLAKEIVDIKTKRAYESTADLTRPLIRLLDEADKPGAPAKMKAAADEIRKQEILKRAVIGEQSNILFELAGKLNDYASLFPKMRDQLKNKKEAILAVNPNLKKHGQIYDKAQQTLEEVAKIYEEKMKGLKPDEIELFNKLIAKDKPKLSEAEYLESVALLSKLATFTPENVDALVSTNSVFQCFLSIKAFTTEPQTKEQEKQLGVNRQKQINENTANSAYLNSSTYSELVQAPMRHPLLMTELTSAAQKVKTVMGPSNLKPEQVVKTAADDLEKTKNVMKGVNYHIQANFMIDRVNVINLIELNKNIAKSKEVDPKTKKLLVGLAKALDGFAQANTEFFLKPNPATKKNFEKAFENLNKVYFDINKPENATLLSAFYATNDGLKNKTKIETALSDTKNGLQYYIRQSNFNKYKVLKMNELHNTFTQIKKDLSQIADKDLQNYITNNKEYQNLDSKYMEHIESLIDIGKKIENSTNDDEVDTLKMQWIDTLTKAGDLLTVTKEKIKALETEFKTPKELKSVVPPIPAPVIPHLDLSSIPKVDPDIVRKRSYKPNIPKLDLSKVRALEHEQQETQEEAHITIINNELDDEKMANTSTEEAHNEEHNDVVVAQEAVLDTPQDTPHIDVHEDEQESEEEKHQNIKKQEPEKPPVPSVQTQKETQPPPMTRVQARVALFKTLIDEQAKQRQIEQAQRTKQRSDTTPVAPNTKLKS